MTAAIVMASIVGLIVLTGPAWQWPSNDNGCWHERGVCIKCGWRRA